MTRERFLELMKERSCQPEEIGKATISVPTVKKDEAQKRQQRDEQEIQQMQEGQQEVQE